MSGGYGHGSYGHGPYGHVFVPAPVRGFTAPVRVRGFTAPVRVRTFQPPPRMGGTGRRPGMTGWRATGLHVQPALIEMADTDRETLAIPLGETVTVVDAMIARYAEPDAALPGIIEAVAITSTNDGARVTLAGLTRGELYELTVTGATADDRVITAALAIRCVV